MIDSKSLAALSAILRHGSFEAAAHELSVTPSAISQRIKSLEDRLGTVLLQRGTPATATETGQRLVQHAEEIGLLEASLAKDLGLPDANAPYIKIATNADSLATWLMPALAECEGMLIELIVDDQDHSADWLRRGEVQAAITSHNTAIQGSDCTPLGNLRYIASCSGAYQERWFSDGINEHSLKVAPALLFNRKDRLQRDWVRQKVGHALALRSHQIPSSEGFVEAALLGLGWGMNPEILIGDHLKSGSLVALDPKLPLDVPLYWQANRRVSHALAPLTKAIHAAAKRALLAP
ncbi:LysR family transcriptional regulator ArgP [Falsihalocynthiibacter sp. SS001]|uniref:LysR family transcriptional regulator ArgP n=1 Tax=Falsihalocynthiibacter sp. SS001 TaxID=3349698 RepID=UPI0036D43961